MRLQASGFSIHATVKFRLLIFRLHIHLGFFLPLLTSKHIMFNMLDWGTCKEVERVAGKVSGAWVFRGSRVPVRALFENLESGASIDDFLKWFPGVTLEQVVAVLAHAEQSLAEV